MSSIVERLRDQWLVIQHPERKQIADLLEQQAARIAELEAELAGPRQRIPDEWQLVPVEPTGAMLQAAFVYLEDIDFIATGVYKAMLSAAPKKEGE